MEDFNTTVTCSCMDCTWIIAREFVGMKVSVSYSNVVVFFSHLHFVFFVFKSSFGSEVNFFVLLAILFLFKPCRFCNRCNLLQWIVMLWLKHRVAQCVDMTRPTNGGSWFKPSRINYELDISCPTVRLLWKLGIHQCRFLFITMLLVLQSTMNFGQFQQTMPFMRSSSAHANLPSPKISQIEWLQDWWRATFRWLGIELPRSCIPNVAFAASNVVTAWFSVGARTYR